MKKVILLGLLITLSSCEEKVRVITPEQARNEAIQKKILEGQEIIDDYLIREFEYKGHTYMYGTVHQGMSAWHAGHCKCNTKN